jgi:hypothetical protein
MQREKGTSRHPKFVLKTTLEKCLCREELASPMKAPWIDIPFPLSFDLKDDLENKRESEKVVVFVLNHPLVTETSIFGHYTYYLKKNEDKTNKIYTLELSL